MIMVFFWQRWGPLALLYPLLGFILWLVIAGIVRAATGAQGTQGLWNVIGLVSGFAIASVAGWFFSVYVVERRLDPKPVTRAPRNEFDSGRIPQGGGPSTLFFLPVRYWAFVTAALGLLLLVPNVLDLASVS